MSCAGCGPSWVLDQRGRLRLIGHSDMRSSLPLILCLCLVLPAGLQARDPSQVDPSKQNTTFAPTPENADTPVSPTRESNQRPFVRNEQVQDERFRVPEKIDRKEAPVAERRSPIEVTETREKTVIDRKDFTTPDLKNYDKSRHDGERYRHQASGDDVKTYDKVGKYQDRMASATEAAAHDKPIFEKKSSFEKINKFLFKRNGPGTEEGRPLVTTAGGEAPPVQDTRKAYNIDWSGTAAVPRSN